MIQNGMLGLIINLQYGTGFPYLGLRKRKPHGLTREGG
jgi:hypothetical protein